MPLESWIEYDVESEFPLENLPFGVFSTGKDGRKRCGVALGEWVVDLDAMHEAKLLPGPEISPLSGCFGQGSLNAFMGLGQGAWREVRRTLQRVFGRCEGVLRDNVHLQHQVLHAVGDVELHLPARIGDYTDFYASKHHAANVGTMFRGKEHALQPNWLHLPVGYHGRSSSIVVSGTDVTRPWGQLPPAPGGQPTLGPSGVVDFELEMGAFIGPGNAMGAPVELKDVDKHLFGLVLVNDWSARDIQRWEYVPLGPFNGKNWATSISPWVVTMDALESFKCRIPKHAPDVLPYLGQGDLFGFDIDLAVQIQPENAPAPTTVAKSNFKHLYWTLPEMVAHHTLGGCNLQPGDLLGTGTISGPGEGEWGSLLELSWNGSRTIAVQEGAGSVERTFLCDGDAVVLKGSCKGEGYTVGFGQCVGKLLPARKLEWGPWS